MGEVRCQTLLLIDSPIFPEITHLHAGPLEHDADEGYELIGYLRIHLDLTYLRRFDRMIGC